MSVTITIEPQGDQTAAQAIQEAISTASALKQNVIFRMRKIELLVAPTDTVELVSRQLVDKLPANGRQ